MPERLHLEANAGTADHYYKIIGSNPFFDIEGPQSPNLSIIGEVWITWGREYPLTGIHVGVDIVRNGAERNVSYKLFVESPALGINYWSAFYENLADLEFAIYDGEVTSPGCASFAFGASGLELTWGGSTVWVGSGPYAHSGEVYNVSKNRPKFLCATEHSRFAGAGVTLDCNLAIGWVTLHRVWNYGADFETGWQYDDGGGRTSVTVVFDTGMSPPPAVAPASCSPVPSCTEPVPALAYVDSWDQSWSTESYLRSDVFRIADGRCYCPYDSTVFYDYRQYQHDYEEYGFYCTVSPITDDTGLLDIRRFRQAGLGCTFRPPLYNYVTVNADSTEATTYSEHQQVSKRNVGTEYCTSGIGACPQPPNLPSLPCVTNPPNTYCIYQGLVGVAHLYEPTCQDIGTIDIDWDRKLLRTLIDDKNGGAFFNRYFDLRPPRFDEGKLGIDYKPGTDLRLKHCQRWSDAWIMVAFTDASDNKPYAICTRSWGSDFTSSTLFEITGDTDVQGLDFEVLNENKFYFVWSPAGGGGIKFIGYSWKGVSSWVSGTVSGVAPDADTHLCVREFFDWGMIPSLALSWIEGGELLWRPSHNGVDYDALRELNIGTAAFGVFESFGTDFLLVFVYRETWGATALKCTVYDSNLNQITAPYTIGGLTVDADSQFAICEGRGRDGIPLLELAYFSGGSKKVATTENLENWTIW